MGKKSRITKKEYRISQSAEILDDHCESSATSCWGSKTPLWKKSKSSEELEVVAAQCLARLEQMRVCEASRSDESLNMWMDASLIRGTPKCCQTEEHTSYLRKMKINMDDTGFPDAMKSINLLHRMNNQQYFENNTQEVQDKGMEEGSSSDSEAEVFVISRGTDHPPITVRPGVSLEKWHGSRSQPGKMDSLPLSHTVYKRQKSTGSVPRGYDGNSTTLEDFVDSYTPQPKSKDSATTPCKKTKHVVEVKEIRQMPNLSPARYYITSKSKKHDLRRALFSYQRSPLETCPEQLAGEEDVWLSICNATGGGKVLVDNEDTLITTTLRYSKSPKSPTYTCGSRRDHLLGPTCVRSRSEERRGSSLPRSHSEKQETFRHSAEGGIISKYQHSVVRLKFSLLIYYIGLGMKFMHKRR